MSAFDASPEVGPEVGPDVVVDARGLRCPLPVIRLAQSARDAVSGAVIEVLATDPAARADIPAWCRLRGQDYLGSQPRGTGGEHTAYRVRVARTNQTDQTDNTDSTVSGSEPGRRTSAAQAPPQR
ncbi:sulfurtransferase TusA family protein [Nostocoides sp. HKS02]|uniref:sulfurtransferase TusA family protein n=1 Tax=Nostocoides sp. HKS02 TaxID=1813880 RepID=UPI0012B4AAE4|nr:hypothetical protein GKE56_06515 [Tetrasphaera sp. HKS02]